MEYEEEDGSEYNTSEVDWGEEPSNSWEEEGDCDYGSWQGEYHKDEPWGDETDSEISYEGTLERVEEPWNEGTDHEISLGEEAEHQEGPWTNEVETEAIYEETSSQRSVGEADQFHDEPWDYEANLGGDYGDNTVLEEEESEFDQELHNFSNQTEPCDESTDGEEDFEPYHIYFSGHGQGPEAYLRWERDLEDWFQANHIPEEEKTSYAEDTLTKDAFGYYDQYACLRLQYDEEEPTWDEMKELLYGEFVEDAAANQQDYCKIEKYPEPRTWILVTRLDPKAKPKKACCLEPMKLLKEILETKAEIKPPVVAKGEQPATKPQAIAQR